MDGHPAGEQPRAERAGDGRQDDVVDVDLVGEGALGQAGPNLAVVLEVGADHDVAAGPADLGIEGGFGGGAGGPHHRREDLAGHCGHLVGGGAQVRDAPTNGLEDLARPADCVGNCPDEEFGAGRLVPGAPLRRACQLGVLGAVEDDVAEVDGVVAVNERVVGLGEDGEPVVFESFDEVDLPERAVPVEGTGHDPGDEFFELGVGAGPGEGGAAHVVTHVEVLVVDPDRVRDPAGYGAHPPPVARHKGQALLDQPDHGGVVEAAGWGVEHHHRTDVHGCDGVLQRQEGGIE